MDASVFNNKLMLLQILLLVWMVEVQGVLLREATHVAIGIDLQLLLLKNLLSLDMMRDLTESSVDDSAGLLLSLLLLSLLHSRCGNDCLHTRYVYSSKGGAIPAPRALENDAFHALANRWKSFQE